MTTIYEVADAPPVGDVATIDADTYKELIESTWGEGFAEDMGDVEGVGHFIKVTHRAIDVYDPRMGATEQVVGCIVQTDTAGNKDYSTYGPGQEELLDEQWDQYEQAVAAWYADEDEEEDEDTGPWCTIHEAPHDEASYACELRMNEDLLDRM